jgi:hypothetical protein
MLFGYESFTWLDTSFFVGNYIWGYMLPSVFTIILKNYVGDWLYMPRWSAAR